MKGKKKKSFIWSYALSICAVILCFVLIGTNLKKLLSTDDYIYLSDIMVEKSTPVLKEQESTSKQIVMNPYNNENVKKSIGFYDMKGTEESQQKSLLLYENTYVQNTGTLYQHEESFDVTSVMDGVVTSVKQDELMGYVIEINHDTNLTSSYQCLSEVLVKEGDNVLTGAKIGMSGIPKIISNGKQSLLLETYFNGNIVDPEEIIGKDLTSIY